MAQIILQTNISEITDQKYMIYIAIFLLQRGLLNVSHLIFGSSLKKTAVQGGSTLKFHMLP